MMSYRFYILLAACITCFSLTSSPARSSAKTEDNNFIVSPAQPCTNNCTGQLLAAKTLDTPNIILDAAKPSSVAKPSSNKRLLWLILGAVLITGGFAGAIFLFFKAYKKANSDGNLEADSEPQSEPNNSVAYRSDRTVIQVETLNNHHQDSETLLKSEDKNLPAQNHLSSSALTEFNSQSEQDIVPLENTTRLPKLDIVEELIKELQSPELAKRRKAVWGLAQQGDSRAVQPLVDMMEHGLNSQEHSLVLEALSQICFRTVKPANKALAVSLQDENADVRKNAIRDLTKIYELVAQVTQLLRHATEDEDVEVQQTAHWALSKLSRVRVSSNNESFSKFQSSFNTSDSSYS